MAAILKRVLPAGAINTNRHLQPSFKSVTGLRNCARLRHSALLRNRQNTYALSNKSLVRYLSTASDTNLEHEYSSSKFTGVFLMKKLRFKLYSHLSALKWPSAGLCATSPFLAAAAYYGYVDKEVLQMLYSAAVFVFINSTALTLFTGKLVGLVALSEDQKVVRITYLTFWGNKKNVYYKVDDIIHLSEQIKPVKNNRIKIQFYDFKDTYNMYIRDCKIDDKRFAVVFGKL